MPLSAKLVLVGWCAAFVFVAWKIEGKKQWGWYERKIKLLPLALLWALLYAGMLFYWKVFTHPVP
jgi:hypothetical protein